MSGLDQYEHELGYAVAVNGSRITGRLLPKLGDQGDDVLQVGGLVKIRTRRSTAYAMVGALWVSQPELDREPVCMVDLDLMGEVLLSTDPEVVGEFQRGVSIYPGLGAGIFAVTDADLACVYARPITPSVVVGTVHQNSSIPAHFVTDRLLGKHFAILGTTGSGKSCAVALVLRSILERHPNGHIVLLDPHNEYTKAFPRVAEVIDPTNLELPYWLMNFEELVATFVSRDGPDKQAEAAILKEVVLLARRRFVAGEGDTDYVTVDTPVPFRLSQVDHLIEEKMGRLDKVDGARPYQRLLARIRALQSDRRFSFMFSGLVVKDTMTDVLARLLRVPVAGRPITIFDLSGVPSEIVDVVVSLMCRMVFDFAVWSRRSSSIPVLLVCEEAHRYVPQNESFGFEPTRRAISRIAKEGRKYAVSLCLVSQRPSELSTTILSQCNTLISLRMTNENDKAFVRAALPEGSVGLVASLPTLQTQEAVIVGDGVSLPMRIRFADLDESCRPQSGTAAFSSSWNQDNTDRCHVSENVESWRRQQMYSGGVNFSLFERERKKTADALV
ncbi:MAG: ATP-binding protein [Rhodospirillales bacterium]|nr:ATP-binding protein [Rhodospirillales bacterium]